jgi:alpha-D-xyloside xylohydrolase
MMRALPLDYRNDAAVADIGDEFMFGPSMLVSPVTQPDATRRDVYLPREPGWINFWSGKHEAGGRTISADAPLDQIPLFVKAGSIIPLGPDEQYADQLSGPIELRIYTGADGAITLYEDDGITYSYEKGQYATTLIRWNEATRTLTIRPREGSYENEPARQIFRVVWVRQGHGVGVDPEVVPDAELAFEGAAVNVIEPHAADGNQGEQNR